MNTQINTKDQWKYHRKSNRRNNVSLWNEYSATMDDWAGFRGIVQNRWSALSDNELDGINGCQDLLIASIVAKYDTPKINIKNEVVTLCGGYKSIKQMLID